jgi:hypothetical protein
MCYTLFFWRSTVLQCLSTSHTSKYAIMLSQTRIFWLFFTQFYWAPLEMLLFLLIWICSLMQLLVKQSLGQNQNFVYGIALAARVLLGRMNNGCRPVSPAGTSFMRYWRRPSAYGLVLLRGGTSKHKALQNTKTAATKVIRTMWNLLQSLSIIHSSIP